MSEIRFKCRQCPAFHDDPVGITADLPVNEFTLPDVLFHWRWHTEQATPGQWRNEPDTHAGRVWVKVPKERERKRFKWPNTSGSPVDLEPIFRVRTSDNYAQREADAAHVARMSPAFTLTLIDQLEALNEAADGLGESRVPEWRTIGEGLRFRVVNVVTAAGYEAVTE